MEEKRTKALLKVGGIAIKNFHKVMVIKTVVPAQGQTVQWNR